MSSIPKHKIVLLYNYLSVGETDEDLIKLFNKHLLGYREKYLDLEVTDYVHYPDYTSTFNKVGFTIKPNYVLVIFKDGNILNGLPLIYKDLDVILEDILVYIKYKNRKDIIESI